MLEWVNVTSYPVHRHLPEHTVALDPGDHLLIEQVDCDQHLLAWLASLEVRGVLRRIWLH
jgi:hypothetical protein